MSYWAGGECSDSVAWSYASAKMTKSLLCLGYGQDLKAKVGNQTNSQDPQAVQSRVFVGNLNTYRCTKIDVERMFHRYGRLVGISMHKGYAFVQFTNPCEAQAACAGEDGRSLLGQVLDVNLVSEPKPHQTGRKRQNGARTGNDWEYYYDSYYRSRARPAQPSKRARLARPDILICGSCKQVFSELDSLRDHKGGACAGCKCGGEPGELVCVVCKQAFSSAWELMVHAKEAHQNVVYELVELESPSQTPPSPPLQLDQVQPQTKTQSD